MRVEVHHAFAPVDDFLQDAELAEDEVETLLEEHADEPAFADVVGETARDVFDALADRAAMPLAVTAAGIMSNFPCLKGGLL